jgi:hypothetical protein
MKNDNKNDSAVQGEISWSSATVDLLSPNKMLVEGATMIYILAFMLFTFTVLLWKGPSLGTSEMMALFFGLILTITLAVRQFAAFRY